MQYVILLFLFFASASFAAPQDKSSGAVQERTSATVVEVPVTVIGKDGKPLTGLTAADFELSDNGRKQETSGFQVADLSRPAVPDTASPLSEATPPVARRHWFLVFDFSY